MQFIYLIGRISLVAIFLGSGARQLLDLSATAQFVQSWMPALFAPYAEKLSTLLGVSTPQLIAIVLAAVQIALSLAIIFNVGSRFAAILLALYLAASTAYVFDFTNFNDLLRNTSDTLLLNNISIIGGLLMLFAIENLGRESKLKRAINEIRRKPAVPEPLAWAMMLLGFIGLGTAFRRSRQSAG